MVSAALSTLFERLPIGAYRSSPAGRQLRANDALVQLNGYGSEAEMLEAAVALDHDWYVLPHRRAEFKALMARDGQVTNFVSEVHRHKSRERIWVRETAHVVHDTDGSVLYYEGTVEDITESHLAAQALVQAEARWRLALEATGDGVWDWHIADRREHCTDGLKALLGYLPHEWDDDERTLNALTHPDDMAAMNADIQAHLAGQTPVYRNEHRVRCKDGQWKWVLSRGMVVERDAAGTPTRMIGTHTDITTRKATEAVIWRQAHYDTLTRLPNRRMLRLQLDLALPRAQATGRTLSVVFMDLDNFKEVNDSLGHNAGDQLLAQAAQRIQAAVGEGNTVARMGGDEFTLVLQDLPPGADATPSLQPRLQALLDAMRQPFELGPDQVFVSASMGVAHYPADATTAEDLLRHADQALFAAKGAGRNRCCFFTAELQAAARLRARLDTDLRGALAASQFQVVYQPIVDMATGRAAKAEALLRWHHPALGPVSPAQFIPIAETSGLIVPIGEWVFQQACHQVADWRLRLDPAFQVSVNKSPVQCQHKVAGHPSWAGQMLAQHMKEDSVVIEITEGLLLDISPAVAAHFAELRDLGMQVSLDDFGTGYSSLTYLQRLDVDFVKIDQSFVRHIETRSTDLALCKAVIAMAHELGMRVVAEGVETQGQRDLLVAAGCDLGQGYWFARPMDPQAFEAWWATTALVG
jgi:diguanylate cyclase (GGDEF)-like protein/PAS domain S-box-containing protein